jgi:hypothetical protein
MQSPSRWPPSWWHAPDVQRYRQVIGLSFVEWLHFVDPLTPETSEDTTLQEQVVTYLEETRDTLLALLRREDKGVQVPDLEFVQEMIHGIGAFMALEHLSESSHPLLGEIWPVFEAVGYPLQIAVERLARYYHLLAEREPPIQDDVHLAAQLFLGERNQQCRSTSTGSFPPLYTPEQPQRPCAN